jgi:hypothetical protein
MAISRQLTQYSYQEILICQGEVVSCSLLHEIANLFPHKISGSIVNCGKLLAIYRNKISKLSLCQSFNNAFAFRILLKFIEKQ